MRGYFRYVPLSFGKATLWRLVAVPLWRSETNVKSRTVWGATMLVNARDIVGRYIYYFGIWEPNLTSWIRRRLRQGDTFIDVGANVGYYSLLASKIVRTEGRVIAIEPLAESLEILKSNLTINLANNVRCADVAAWDTNELITIFTKRSNYVSGVSTVVGSWAKLWKLKKLRPVAGRRLVDIVLRAEAVNARIIKIDVEGSEWRVIQGMEGLLEACRADVEIILEISPWLLKSEGKTCQDVLEFFRGKGFHGYLIENDYSPCSYISHHAVAAPRRIHSVPDDLFQADLIFSRVDALWL
jgi:FkbM family methyltransferase